MSLHLAFLLVLTGCAGAAPGLTDTPTEDNHIITQNVTSVSTNIGSLACSLRPQDQSFTIGQKDESLSVVSMLNSTSRYTTSSLQTAISSEYYTYYYFEVVDTLKNGTNAIVTKIDGGVGAKRIRLRFEFCPNDGSEYLIYVWGKFDTK